MQPSGSQEDEERTLDVVEEEPVLSVRGAVAAAAAAAAAAAVRRPGLPAVAEVWLQALEGAGC